MSDHKQLADILIAIENGELDDALGDIVEIIATRRQILRQRSVRQKLKTLGKGDTVRITGSVKPRYLLGWTGEIIEVRPGGKMVVQGRPIRKFMDGVIICPVAMIEKVADGR